jgi:hypothetical protein
MEWQNFNSKAILIKISIAFGVGSLSKVLFSYVQKLTQLETMIYRILSSHLLTKK